MIVAAWVLHGARLYTVLSDRRVRAHACRLSTAATATAALALVHCRGTIRATKEVWPDRVGAHRPEASASLVFVVFSESQ